MVKTLEVSQVVAVDAGDRAGGVGAVVVAGGKQAEVLGGLASFGGGDGEGPAVVVDQFDAVAGGIELRRHRDAAGVVRRVIVDQVDHVLDGLGARDVDRPG